MVATRKVYTLRSRTGFEWLLPANEEDFELLRFVATPRSHSWMPVEMERLRVWEDGRPLEPSDFPACSGGDMLMLSGAAKQKIGPYLQQYGELLPLVCGDGEFWALNVTRLVDALDENESKLLRASDTGAILMIHKHAFRNAELDKADIFKLPQMVRGLIYVTDPFVDVINASGLKGLEFVQVWP